MPKRNDATWVPDIKVFNRIFPYLMTKRSESLVYYNMEIEMTNAVNYIRQKNKDCGEKRYRIFDVLLASLVRTFALKPLLNRFIANSEYWQRKELSFNFIVKKDLTEDAPERNAIVKFNPDMTFDEIAAIIYKAINDARENDESGEESTIKFFLKMPKFLLRFAIKQLKRMDEKGHYPKALREADGLHVSAYVANLGSINIANPPIHHLYEWGTTSLFFTMGKMHRKRLLDENDNEYIKDTLEMMVTLDERIAEGFYYMKAIKTLQTYIENPKLLEKRPDLSNAR